MRPLDTNIKTPVFEHVAYYLRKKILNNELQSGEHLNETSISSELNISRGPVRDAIKRLEMDGLVETLNNGRTLVRGFHEESFLDWLHTRINLETHAIEEIFRKKLDRSTHFHSLIELVEKMKSLKKDKSEFDISIEAGELDLLFHNQIVQLSRNGTLKRLWQPIYGILVTLMELNAQNYKHVDKQTQTHAFITEKLLLGDSEAAISLLSEHILDGGNITIEALKMKKLYM